MKRSGFFLAVVPVAACVTWLAASAQPAGALPPVPPQLAVSQQAIFIDVYQGTGVQVYGCGPQNTWVLKGPEAELKDGIGKVIARHYAGPTWESPDGSKIVGTVIKTAAAPKAGAIPWLLLSVHASGAGQFADVHYVQRLATDGGVGPTGACSASDPERRVPYSAEYAFYK